MIDNQEHKTQAHLHSLRPQKTCVTTRFDVFSPTWLVRNFAIKSHLEGYSWQPGDNHTRAKHYSDATFSLWGKERQGECWEDVGMGKGERVLIYFSHVGEKVYLCTANWIILK